jgi:SH3-like domain-containing protein
MIRFVVVLAAALAAASAAFAASEREMPRFVSIRAEKAHLRTGPGTRYPVEWVYTRRDMPVEVVAEFDAWRQVRDWQGTTGWMHSSVLSARRSVIVSGATVHSLMREPRADAQEIAKLEPGVIAKLIGCNEGWCRIEVSSFRGWLERGQFWGVRDGERIP